MIQRIKALRPAICIFAGLLGILSFLLTHSTINWLAIFGVIVVACTTMAQNDWRDRLHDAKKGKDFALQNQKSFFVFLISLWVLVTFIIVLSYFDNKNICLYLIAISFIGAIYSEIRRIPLLPMLSVAFTSASPALLPILHGVEFIIPLKLFIITTCIILAREISKDIEDTAIDEGYKWTLPLKIGNQWAQAIAILFILISFAVLTKISLFAALAFPFASFIIIILYIIDCRINYLRNYLDIVIVLVFIAILLK